MPLRSRHIAAVTAAAVTTFVPAAAGLTIREARPQSAIERTSSDLMRTRTLLERAGGAHRAHLERVGARMERRKARLLHHRHVVDRRNRRDGSPDTVTTLSEARAAPPAPIVPAVSMPLDIWTRTYPLAARGTVIGTPYAGTHRRGNWQSDNAVDLAAPAGTPVLAVEDGIVGARVGPLGGSDPALAGQRLTVIASQESYYYAHLSVLFVAPGQPVRRGQTLGLSGSANGVAHLHLGVRNGDPRAVVGLPAPIG